jgi:hypothetical protein
MAQEVVCPKCEASGKKIIVPLDVEPDNDMGSQWGGICPDCGEHYSFPINLFD